MPSLLSPVVTLQDLEETRQLLLSQEMPVETEPRERGGSGQGGGCRVNRGLAVPLLSVADSQASATIVGNVPTDALLSMLGLAHVWTRPHHLKSATAAAVDVGQKQYAPPPPPLPHSQSTAVVTVAVDDNAIDIDDI